MPSCPRCRGWTFSGFGRERWCVVCGWQSYGPVVKERQKQFKCACGAYYEKNGTWGPAPSRCPPCRQFVRMEQKGRETPRVPPSTEDGADSRPLADPLISCFRG